MSMSFLAVAPVPLCDLRHTVPKARQCATALRTVPLHSYTRRWGTGLRPVSSFVGHAAKYRLGWHESPARSRLSSLVSRSCDCSAFPVCHCSASSVFRCSDITRAACLRGVPRKHATRKHATQKHTTRACHPRARDPPRKQSTLIQVALRRTCCPLCDPPMPTVAPSRRSPRRSAARDPSARQSAPSRAPRRRSHPGATPSAR